MGALYGRYAMLSTYRSLSHILSKIVYNKRLGTEFQAQFLYASHLISTDCR